MTAQETITAAVDQVMRRRGMTRAQLARDLGVGRSWVSNKLSGRRGWMVEDLDLLAEWSGMPLAAFLVPVVDELGVMRARRDRPARARDRPGPR